MLVCLLFADRVELADTPDLGSGAVRHTGSSPAIRTNNGTRISADLFSNHAGFWYFEQKNGMVKIYQNGVKMQHIRGICNMKCNTETALKNKKPRITEPPQEYTDSTKKRLWAGNIKF